MKLPAISVASTPACVSRDANAARRGRRSLAVAPATPSILPPLRTCNQSIPRLNPLHPPTVRKRTVSLETPTAHHHNHQRALIMQRREYDRFHTMWRKPLYGTGGEKEEYRRELREHLKGQMEEKCAALRSRLAGRGREAERLREVDRLAITGEREQRLRHKQAMSAFRDENKRLMEQSWRDKALMRSQEALEERELLRLTPINWSGTLK